MTKDMRRPTIDQLYSLKHFGRHRNRIVMKFCSEVLVPVIIQDIFSDNRFRGFEDSGGRIFSFAFTVATVLACTLLDTAHRTHTIVIQVTFPSIRLYVLCVGYYCLRVVCHKHADIAIILDHTTSVVNPARGGWENWNLILDFVVKLVEAFPIGPSMTRVGIVGFGTDAWLDFGFNAYNNSRTMRTAVRNLEIHGGSTNIGQVTHHFSAFSQL